MLLWTGLAMTDVRSAYGKPAKEGTDYMDVKALQSIAGHSDIKMTLDHYAHRRAVSIIAAGGLTSGVFRSM